MSDTIVMMVWVTLQAHSPVSENQIKPEQSIVREHQTLPSSTYGKENESK